MIIQTNEPQCDEQRPSCCNCILHGVKCPFSVAHQQGKSSALPTLEPRSRLAYHEMELLHHFTTQTSTTLATDASVREFWKVDVVRIGFQCHYIGKQVFSVRSTFMAMLWVLGQKIHLDSTQLLLRLVLYSCSCS